MADGQLTGSRRSNGTLAAVRAHAREIAAPRDYARLLESIGDARFALLGEASHGTDGFYRERAEITKRLITEIGCGETRWCSSLSSGCAKNTEEYYRTMFRGRVSSWNRRDAHMVQTIQALDLYLATHYGAPRMAVWAHNSHLGDAAATEMGDAGEWNVGQLMREHYADAVRLIGFSTHHGSVTAARRAPDIYC